MSVTFSSFTQTCIYDLRQEGRFATAHLYDISLRSFCKCLGHDVIRFSEINRNSLYLFKRYLIERHYSPNTQSTYMRMLRALYNKAVYAGLAKHVYNLFHDVFTGIDKSHKKAMSPVDLNKLFFGKVSSPALIRAQQIARLMYCLCGIPFVDFQHVGADSVKDGSLNYSRRKTGVCVSIPVNKETVALIEKAAVCPSDMNTEEGYRHYQSLLRKFNASLSRLASKLGIKAHVSSYTIRHSWATTALYCHVPVEVISSALGHADIKTTQIYLKGFNAKEIGLANRKVCRCVENK
ncbi:tyrosine-type recombinase/integrase [Prevotella herbatica]|uniref:tyrosine-type recombinase/integrase n=1 Tax=Prevotella herbatica TaxID=2801997 RepID=UPI001A91442A|nr:site-specific integrase [Prevotella herbatica]